MPHTMRFRYLCSRHSFFAFALLFASAKQGYAEDAVSEGDQPHAVAAVHGPDPHQPEIIDHRVLVADQGVDASTAGPGHCRHHGLVYRQGQLLSTVLTCFKVLCKAGELHWVPDPACCPSEDGLQPEKTRQATADVCMVRHCAGGRWLVQPDYDLCCEHERFWYPVGSTRPMQGGPCTYQLCHAGVWESHYNTSCCFDAVGWHTPGTVLFTSDPCRTKTCRAARWTEQYTCCLEPGSHRPVASGDIRRTGACAYWLCRERAWHRRTAFSCCERDGHQYEHGAVVNLGSTCHRDRCVDGSWHVVRRERVSRVVCRRGWHRLGPRCVKNMKDATWHEAEHGCRKEGGYLLTIADKAGWAELEKVPGNRTLWLGLRGHQHVGDVTDWNWVDGTPRSVPVLWASGQPQRRAGHVCVFSLHGRAHTSSCDDRRSVLCQYTGCEH